MVGFVEGTRTIDITGRLDMLDLSQGTGLIYSWKKRPKLRQDLHEWMMTCVGPGGYWTADPEQHGWLWGLEHHANVNWKEGAKNYQIYSSILTFADADRAMLFKLTWI